MPVLTDGLECLCQRKSPAAACLPVTKRTMQVYSIAALLCSHACIDGWADAWTAVAVADDACRLLGPAGCWMDAGWMQIVPAGKPSSRTRVLGPSQAKAQGAKARVKAADKREQGAEPSRAEPSKEAGRPSMDGAA